MYICNCFELWRLLYLKNSAVISDIVKSIADMKGTVQYEKINKIRKTLFLSYCDDGIGKYWVLCCKCVDY